jgi:hypothetical protein
MFLFFNHRADRAVRSQCSTSHAPGRKLIAQLQSGWQLAIRFDKYRANGNSEVPAAGIRLYF